MISSLQFLKFTSFHLPPANRFLPINFMAFLIILHLYIILSQNDSPLPFTTDRAFIFTSII